MLDWMHESRRSAITVNGVRLSYLEWGAARPQTPSLLCLHGLIATAESFAALADHLPEDQHVLALDLPANGSSETCADLDVSFSGLAQLTAAFMEAVGLRRPVVVGHSHGGALALRMASMDPGATRGLVLLSPAHPFSGHEPAIVEFYLSVPGGALARVLPWLPKWLQFYAFRRMLGSHRRFESAQFLPYRRNLRKQGIVAHVLRLLRSWAADMESLGRDLGRQGLAMPVLLIWGAEDPVVPASTGPLLQARLGAAELIRLPGIGHLPSEEAPEQCALLIEDWLRRLRT